MDAQTRSRVWWQGAISSAVKGIPQGLLLGAIGFGLLVGSFYLFSAMGLAGPVLELLAQPFGGFLFAPGGIAAMAETTALPALGLGNLFTMLNPLPVIALNTVLTAVGNFLTGGDIAVAKYQQEFDHTKNETRIRAIEGREQQMEQALVQHLHDPVHHIHAAKETPKHVQQILSQGPRVRVEKEASESHTADIVADRLETAERTIH